jgi:hypothetical protein
MEFPFPSFCLSLSRPCFSGGKSADNTHPGRFLDSRRRGSYHELSEKPEGSWRNAGKITGNRTKEAIMKRTARLLSVTATALCMVALPAWGAGREPEQPGALQREDCLLVAALDNFACPNHVDSIDNRIERLQREVAKGSRVYSPEQLKYLEKELAQFQAMHEYLHRNAPYGGY